MKGKAGLLIGLILMLIGALFLILDILAGDVLHIIFAVLIFGFSVLSGRNVAYLLHDSAALKRRTGNIFSPKGMISMWMFFFIVAIIMYTAMSALFFKSVGAVMAGISSSYTGLIYSTLALMAAYFVFKSASDKNPDRLYSSWGKRMEKMKDLGKNMINTGMEMFRRSFP